MSDDFTRHPMVIGSPQTGGHVRWIYRTCVGGISRKLRDIVVCTGDWQNPYPARTGFASPSKRPESLDVPPGPRAKLRNVTPNGE
jgi:hypothetical protein